MITWREAYQRTVVDSDDFQTLFGRRYGIGDFQYYAHVLKFESMAPALLAAAAATPNTGSLEVTLATIAAPATNIVPGEALESLLNFPLGAIILGVTSCATLPQRVTSGASFKYGPSNNPGVRDLYVLDMEFVDTSDIVAGAPVPEISVNANSPYNTAPPILADALMGSGIQDLMPGRELLVAPGLGIITRARSMVLPNDPQSTGLNYANLTVHVVFHCMVPGKLKFVPGQTPAKK